MDFTYQRYRLPGGVKIEEVSGGSRYTGRVWTEIARQIYCENGKEGYRDLGHFQSGAPFLYDEDARISISHTYGCLVVATLAVSPDVNLSEFSLEAALGVDVERADRRKALELRERFLTDEELKLLTPDSVEQAVAAWTCKEALLKASMDSSINWKEDLRILRMPEIVDLEVLLKTKEAARFQGEGEIRMEGTSHRLALTTFRTGPYLVTLTH